MKQGKNAQFDNEGELALLTDTYTAPLMRYFRRHGVAETDAEDLVQEVFVRLVRVKSLESVNNSEAFVFRVASNILRDASRRKTARQFSKHDEYLDDSHSCDIISPERVLISREDLQGIKTEILKMPEKMRATFILHRFEGLKYREIASTLNISMSSVEKNMIQAIARIAQKGRKQ